MISFDLIALLILFILFQTDRSNRRGTSGPRSHWFVAVPRARAAQTRPQHGVGSEQTDGWERGALPDAHVQGRLRPTWRRLVSIRCWKRLWCWSRNCRHLEAARARWWESALPSATVQLRRERSAAPTQVSKRRWERWAGDVILRRWALIGQLVEFNYARLSLKIMEQGDRLKVVHWRLCVLRPNFRALWFVQ